MKFEGVAFTNLGKPVWGVSSAEEERRLWIFLEWPCPSPLIFINQRVMTTTTICFSVDGLGVVAIMVFSGIIHKAEYSWGSGSSNPTRVSMALKMGGSRTHKGRRRVRGGVGEGKVAVVVVVVLIGVDSIGVRDAWWTLIL